jgi:hypothetical protein
MISILTATRRPDGYIKMVDDIESKLSDVVTEYVAFVNDIKLKPLFREIQKHNSKIKIIYAKDDFIFRNGFDSVYNSLMKAAKSKYVLMVFDADEIVVDKDKLIKELDKDLDIYTFQMYMQRGNVWENKIQLYKREGVLQWFGLVHENQKFLKQPSHGILDKDVFYIMHYNARDKNSQELKKTNDGFIILEETEDGTDSDIRNILYESLTWKIVNENGRHMHKPWFEKHYEINKDMIDKYYQKAKNLWMKAE